MPSVVATSAVDRIADERAEPYLLDEVGVSFVLEVPGHQWVRRVLGRFRQSEKDTDLWTATGELYGARLLSVERRRRVEGGEDGALDLETYEVEQPIPELYQLGFGRTAVDDLEGNAILVSLGTLTYQVLHVVRTTALTGEWRRAQPAPRRAWLFRLPAKLTTHARKRHPRRARARAPIWEGRWRQMTVPSSGNTIALVHQE